MSDERARDVLSRQSEFEAERADYETVWEQVSEFCDPDGPDLWNTRSGYRSSQSERNERRGTRVYDNTINSAANRLAAGLESLIIPQSEKWHGLSTEAIDDDETEEEKEWAEGLRDFLFLIRYSANSNFVPAAQACLRNVVRYGPAYLYAEEGFGGSLVRYASIPVVEGYISRNRWGIVDTFHRKYERTARQVAQIVGYDKLPAKIRALVDDPAKCDQKVCLTQAIRPRDERRTSYAVEGIVGYLDSPFESLHVIEEEEAVIKEGNFQSFPISCFNWRRYEGDTYGISPTIEALTTVREINAVRRTGLRALQQITDPSTASKANLDFVPVLNPGQNYAGLIDDNGRPLIQPINTGQNPTYAFDYANARAEEIRDMLYVNLFQILVQNPEMTATEALIRQEEKGALLGPSGSIIQSGFAANLDRELSILEEKGLYEADSRFLPPQSLAGKSIRPTFTSPLDIFRKAAESRDADMIVTAAVQYAKASQDPTILDNIDGDEYIQIKKDASRAPQRLLRRQEEVNSIREARKQAQQAQAGMAALTQAAGVAKDAVLAAVQAQESGLGAALSHAMPQGNA